MIEQKIGFDKVRSQVRSKCISKYAVARVDGEQFCTDRQQILHRLQLTDEMRLICMFEDTFPSEGFTDSRELLLPLTSESTSISLPALVTLRTTLDTVRKVVTFFDRSKDGVYPNLKEMSRPVAYFPEVSRRIDSIIDRYGNVRDNASDALAGIRRLIREKEKSVSKVIASILRKAQGEGYVEEDVGVAMRDGKTLIPVAAAHKHRIAGIVYDQSASGKTVFIEPIEIVEMNNRLYELHQDEQAEIARILAQFTEFLRPYLPELLQAAEFLGEIDFIRAKALVALDMIAGMPVISQDGELWLRKARHPILEKALAREGKKIVPLNLHLDRNKRILVISGPNAGGKSVCLKTVGLLQYMFQWGMLIPTSEVSEFVIFDDIFIDIGDDQSLENDLSTYSSHLQNLKEIVVRSGKKSLVLIDEFGSGTEPAAGGAIAEAVLAQIEENGAYGVITTHYTNLKLYAENSKGCANGAMLFDVENIQPLFQLEQGLPGNSFAFELARKIGFPEFIVKNAQEKAGSDFVDMERQLRKIARNRKALDEKLTKVRSADKTLEGLTDRYQKELAEIKALKKSILDEARAEAKAIVKEANKQVERTVREIRESQAEKEKTKAARAELADYAARLEEENQSKSDRDIEKKMEQIAARKERERKRKEARARKQGIQAATEAEKQAKAAEEEAKRPLQIGDKVKVIGSDLIGEVSKLTARKVSVSIGSITSTMARERVQRISATEYKNAMKTNAAAAGHVTYSSDVYSNDSVNERRLRFTPSIDVRGERVNDAIDKVLHFMDDALMVGVGQVTILHGKGNGVLREEIRKYLRTIGGVESFGDAPLDQGGAGITVVKLQ
ncbi:MAG: Smr/MutS family protein [Bacteroidales bacterium]|nr:Smr/MutS family protein [Bacteroidales bacterium]